MSAHTHGNCHQILTQLNDYADQSLSPALCIDLETHLAECANCRIVLDTLNKTIYLVHQLPGEEPLPVAVEGRLFAALDLGEYVAGSQ